MNKKEADEKAKMIFIELNEEHEKIIEKAIQDGIWKQGLDSNKSLFVEADNIAKEKLAKLALEIEE